MFGVSISVASFRVQGGGCYCSQGSALFVGSCYTASSMEFIGILHFRCLSGRVRLQMWEQDPEAATPELVSYQYMGVAENTGP